MSKDLRLSAPTVLVVAAVVGAAAFAAGRSTSGAAVAVDPAVVDTTSRGAPVAAAPDQGELPPGHPPMGGELPTGHPPIDPSGGAMTTGAGGALGGEPSAAEGELAWKVPARWQAVPSTSSMRLATYRIPHAPGDAEDPEMSVMQAGGSVDANVQRWIGQFDAEGQKTAKRATKKVGPLEVTIVEVDGTFSGGMGMGGKERGAEPGWSLLGVIVATSGMPHFFKMTGPTKSVKAARAELDSLVATFAPR